MSEWLRMPDGTTTGDVEALVQAWRDLAAPVEAITGMKLYGFGNGISLTDGKRFLELPTWFALVLKKHLSTPNCTPDAEALCGCGHSAFVHFDRVKECSVPYCGCKSFTPTAVLADGDGAQEAHGD